MFFDFRASQLIQSESLPLQWDKLALAQVTSRRGSVLWDKRLRFTYNISVKFLSIIYLFIFIVGFNLSDIWYATASDDMECAVFCFLRKDRGCYWRK